MQSRLKDFESSLNDSSKGLQQPPSFDPFISNYRVVDLLQNFKASAVAEKLGMSKSTLSYHVKKLQVLGIVEKKGKGVWQVLVKDKKEIRARLEKTYRTKYPLRSSRKGGLSVRTIVKSSDSIRTHALQFVVKLPSSIKGWNSERRRERLDSRAISYRVIQQGEAIDDLLSARVWLTSKSLVVWLPQSFFVVDAGVGYGLGVYELLKVIKRLESLLGVSFRIGGRFVFRPARQHHALIKNALAKQYNKEKEKLYVYDQRGLWLLVDDSEGLSELEEVGNRGERGGDSHENVKRVQAFFNGVKATGLTPEGILAMIHANQSQLQYYAQNVEAHVDAVKEIRDAVRELRDAVRGLGK